jgi:alpha-tubulin suppressor-like RCC1 family protein
MAEFDVGTLDAGGNLSEERKLTLLRRQNMTADELEAEEEDDEDFWANVDLMKMSRLDLKLALQARGLTTKGTKKKLRQRLEQSIEEEKQEELEFLAMVEAARRAEAALEEGGSVYTTGDNRKGQLGLGDRNNRSEFTVLRTLRSKGIAQVFCGRDNCLALSEDGNTYSWGGAGNGPLGYESTARLMKLAHEEREPTWSSDDEEEEAKVMQALKADQEYQEPKLIVGIEGEGIIEVAIGPTHAAAISDGGDLYTWGAGVYGQLGFGDYSVVRTPKLVQSLQDGSTLRQVACGQSHTIALTDKGTVYAWGFSNDGKLGIGILARAGIEKPFCHYFPTPILVGKLARKVVHQVSCGPNHSLALTDLEVFSWGSGDGGRLGLGDDRNRETPVSIDSLKGQIVLQISAGNWHSAAVVLIPPNIEAGYCYTWGSGHCGQLGQEEVTCSRKPALVHTLLDQHVNVTRVKCGSYHTVCMTDSDELYAFGSNKYGALGCEPEMAPALGYTPKALPIKCFNTMINRIGRGVVRDFDVGAYMTICCTFPYQGPTEEQLYAMEEEAERRAEEEAQERERAQREERARRNKEMKDAERKALDEMKLAELARKNEDDVTETMGDKPIYAR